VARDMRNRVVFVTGATSGIGKETARQLAAMGARVVIGAKDRESGERARVDLTSAGSAPIEVVAGDLSVNAGVRRVAAEFQERVDRLDVLIHNAGVDVGQRATTADGFEVTFAVNYLAPFLLTGSLLALLKASVPARVLTMVSSGHRGGHIDFGDLQHERRFSGQRAYNDSKLALVLFTYELAHRLEGSGVTANCVDPGFVRGTNIGRTLPFAYRAIGAILLPFMTTPTKAAAGVSWAATAPELADVTGAYLKRGERASSSKDSRDRDLARRLWDVTEQLVKQAE
jgi:NAD(P)-dependent dehydrogenase (short-subunit alcohol dehydrogenase family)